ncbi:unnamed protein product [Cuscuta europaea]|uniref:Uncharacterized protein n=1 Tax=Cuscuta europaea TaxID=41803 RepID=A0A9P1E7S2_CUSEU|nr:unnamed protein product [Cuscuta europaea]
MRNNDGSCGNFPPEVDTLVDMQVLFKVKTKKNPNVYKGRKTFSVIDSIKDPSVISLYSHEKETAEEEDEFTALRKELYENEKETRKLAYTRKLGNLHTRKNEDNDVTIEDDLDISVDINMYF